VLSDPYWNLLKQNFTFLKQMQVFKGRCHSMSLTVFHTHVQLLQEDAEYFRLHLDRRLTWHKHILAKRKQGITFTKMYWLFTCKLKLYT
jgi:hypothetical protein